MEIAIGLLIGVVVGIFIGMAIRGMLSNKEEDKFRVIESEYREFEAWREAESAENQELAAQARELQKDR